MPEKKYPLLAKIESPNDLKKLAQTQLPELADEIRNYLVDSLDICGGHFASSLGALELTIALHYVFNTPSDRLIWDVGHQSYIHKVLTERKDKLSTIKKDGGLAPFPKREESQYDTFGVGHSSTSISAALGMSEAFRLKRSIQKSVAVIGDGAMTAGMAFEALNHAGGLRSNLLVVLNDNEMSISENVGALTHHLTKVLSGSFYHQFREQSKKVLTKIPGVWEFAKRFEAQTKGMLLPGNLFEALGFYYVGPIDGHNLDELVPALETLKDHQGPALLHVITKKGKGYEKAEEDPIKFHHVSPSFHSEQTSKDQVQKSPTYSNIFGRWLCERASKDKALVGITPAMREGSDLVAFSKQFPDRYFDVAIAEQHAVTLAAGLACEGLKPVVAIYSTFLQRAYDQFIHDVSIQNLDVLYAIDRGGLVGADGPTHAGSFDLSFMRCIPNMLIMAPSDENEMYHMLEFGYAYKGPAAVRYPRGSVAQVDMQRELDIELGKAKLRRKGSSDLVILSFGTMLNFALEAAEVLNATVYDMRFVKPLDEALLQALPEQFDYIITIEENAILGGAGSAVNEYMIANDLHQKIRLRNLGLPDTYLPHGNPAKLLTSVGLSADGIIDTYQLMKSPHLSFS
ncbi:1-deoxy-D-xylulose-5-phosphate synthase [Thiotrichales bacterium 19S3-7]|nr:1-deoxy-D-xylulose-5-phosphate synthase [Thiotrichales bacterium 19S3-7]MCF6802823.1 1-deoxy-D-xylulose-5-phosphate synthase [Thiotrichales bacterium 19S3-11]